MTGLDPSIHPPARLKLMTTLTAVSQVEFSTLRGLLEVSDSVMSKHVAALVADGYVRSRKGVHLGHRTTWISLTPAGRKALGSMSPPFANSSRTSTDWPPACAGDDDALHRAGRLPLEKLVARRECPAGTPSRGYPGRTGVDSHVDANGRTGGIGHAGSGLGCRLMGEFWKNLTGRGSGPARPGDDEDVLRLFVNAEHPRDVLQRMLTAELKARVLVLHGVGGVGKSTLLDVYRIICRRGQIPTAFVRAEETASELAVLTAWSGDLSLAGVDLPTFDHDLAAYRAIYARVRARAQPAPDPPRDWREVAGTAAGKAAETTATVLADALLPGFGAVFGGMVGAGSQAAVDALRNYLSRPDFELYTHPAERLTEAFVTDLAAAAGGHPRIVLMLDTYEQLGALDGWLGTLARQLPAGVLLILAGRVIPQWHDAWLGWRSRAEVIELAEMDPADFRDLIRRHYYHARGEFPSAEQVEAVRGGDLSKGGA